MTCTTSTLDLPVLPPYDRGIFDFLAARAIPGIEEGTRSSYARVLRLANGDGWFKAELHDDGGEPRFLVRAKLEDGRDEPSLLRTVRRLFDLDADPAVIDAVLRSPLETPDHHFIPGIRLPGAVNPDEILIRAMIGQQITVAAARTALVRLSELGELSSITDGRLVRHFPSAAQLADGARDLLRGPRRRIEAVCHAAELLASGELKFSAEDTVEDLSMKLLPLPGIGPWTVGYVAMRVLGAPDIFLPTDAAVRNGITALTGETPSQSAAAAYARPFSPWRSYATLHLWRIAAQPRQRAPAVSPN